MHFIHIFLVSYGELLRYASNIVNTTYSIHNIRNSELLHEEYKRNIIEHVFNLQKRQINELTFVK